MCVSNIKIPYDDFKKIKAYRHAASCQELMFICQLLLDSGFIGSKDYENGIDAAFNLYVKASTTKCLIRNIIIMTEVLQSIGRHKDAAKLLIRGSKEVQ